MSLFSRPFGQFIHFVRLSVFLPVCRLLDVIQVNLNADEVHKVRWTSCLPLLVLAVAVVAMVVVTSAVDALTNKFRMHSIRGFYFPGHFPPKHLQRAQKIVKEDVKSENINIKQFH